MILTHNRGLTEVKMKIDDQTGRYLYIKISHTGNMGDCKADVYHNAKKILAFDIRESKKWKLIKEEGSPDYFYSAIYKKI